MPSPRSLPLFIAPVLLLSGLDAQLTLLQLKAPSTAGREYARYVSNCGDMDGDGFADFLVGIPNDSSAVGAVHVHSGRNGRILRRLVGPTSPKSQFGDGLAAAGDVDRDGTPDFLVSGKSHPKNGKLAGFVQVISGRSGSVIHTMWGHGPGDLFGSAMASVGDIDKDGHPDLLIGAPENGEPVTSYGTGYAELYSGKTGKLMHRFQGYEIMSEFGLGVGAPGDVDKDGVPDILVGSGLEGFGLGSARLYSGRTKKELYNFPATADGDHFGMILTGAGDVDRDGYLDIVLGQPNAFQRRKGVVWVFSGKTGKALHEIKGLPGSGMFGMSICPLGDINGDGHADFAVGDPMDGTLGKRTGSVRIFSGKDGSQLQVIYGKGFAFGVVTISLGDLSGDGLPELLVPTPDETQPGSAQGTVRVISLASTARFGFGCSASVVAPSLDAAAFRIGKSTSMFLNGRASQSGVLFWSAVPDTPLSLATKCDLHLDVASMMLVRPITTDRTGRWTDSIRVPNRRSLIGCVGALQCALGPTAAPLGFDMSNGMYFTIAR